MFIVIKNHKMLQDWTIKMKNILLGKEEKIQEVKEQKAQSNVSSNEENGEDIINKVMSPTFFLSIRNEF